MLLCSPLINLSSTFLHYRVVKTHIPESPSHVAGFLSGCNKAADSGRNTCHYPSPTLPWRRKGSMTGPFLIILWSSKYINHWTPPGFLNSSNTTCSEADKKGGKAGWGGMQGPGHISDTRCVPIGRIEGLGGNKDSTKDKTFDQRRCWSSR